MDFVHLHMHTEYSLLDGSNKIKELVAKIKELGMSAVAITDHGNMFGAVEMYKECKKEGIKAIIGVEAYVAPRSRFEKEAKVDTEPNHLILLAMNNNGYKNIVKLVSLSYTEGFYYKPRIDMELLEKYNEDIICLSACMAGAVPRKIAADDINGAKELALKYKEIFKDRYYLEIQDNKYPEQLKINQNLIDFSRELDIPLVATNDCHYLTKDDYDAHEALLCIQTKKKLSDEDRMTFKTNEFYVKSPSEMENSFKSFPEALSNTVEIAKRCNVQFEFGHTILPNFDVPKGITHYNFFRNMCYEGLKKRYNEKMYDKAVERLEYELGVIEKMGFIDYFLIVQDFINYAKKKGIPVGPGRGSGAGSVAAYASGITDIDPLKFSLIFERFLNPERISMPDFDVDFCFERRPEVIEYVGEKYGKDHVAQIITFGTLKAKAAVRDIARVIDVPYAKADSIAKMIPNDLHMTISKALEINSELKTLYDTDEETKKIIDLSMKVEGLPRHASTHAAGVVITKDPVDTYVPLYLNGDQISTEYTMTVLEELGLLKMDFLGLRTLTVINDAKYLVKKIRNIDVDFGDNFDDEGVYKLLSEGKTTGVFQLESAGMRQVMKELKPTSIEDIIVLISLYRPGPMDQIPRYIRSKNDPEHIEYTHPALAPILKNTYGCMVYQEQVMQIFRELAGYSFGRADLVRRAMGKKKIDVMNKEREIFIHGLTENGEKIIDGAIARGIDEASANKIFDEMAEFAKYAFNKSHAACYAVVSYETAYLKVHYPAEFMAAMMNSFLGNLDKVPEYISECKVLGVNVLRPDINESYSRFAVINGNIRFALASIKNIGELAIDQIVEERKKNGKYKSFIDFLERVESERVNKKCIESLIKAGAFDELEKDYTRYDLLSSFEGIIDSILNERKNNIKNQVSLFDAFSSENEKNQNRAITKAYAVPSKRDLLDMEKEMTGLYISGHPLDEYLTLIESIETVKASDLLKESNEDEISENSENKINLDGMEATMCGLVTNLKKIYTKSNRQMAFSDFEDTTGSIEAVFFPTIYEKSSNIINSNKPLILKGKINFKENEKPKILVDCIRELAKESKLYIKLNCNEENEKEEINKIFNILKGNEGEVPVYIYLNSKQELKLLSRQWWINPKSDVIHILQNEFGDTNIKLI